MSIALVQSANGIANPGSSVSASWPAATTAGSLLVAIVVEDANNAITMTGWTSAVRSNYVNRRVQIFYKENASSESGSVTASFGASTYGGIFIFEYSGVALTSALDKTATADGTTNPASSGTTAATTQDDEVCLTGILVLDSGTFSSPTNSFTLDAQVTPGSRTAAACRRIVTSSGTYGHNLTYSAVNKSFLGAIATFKAALPPSGSDAFLWGAL